MNKYFNKYFNKNNVMYFFIFLIIILIIKNINIHTHTIKVGILFTTSVGPMAINEKRLYDITNETIDLYNNSQNKIYLEKYIYSPESTEETYINRFTKLDPTLPRMQKMPCPNKECQTNISSEPVEIILIRYDNKNLKYLYLCSVCDYSWKTDIKN